MEGLIYSFNIELIHIWESLSQLSFKSFLRNAINRDLFNNRVTRPIAGFNRPRARTSIGLTSEELFRGGSSGEKARFDDLSIRIAMCCYYLKVSGKYFAVRLACTYW